MGSPSADFIYYERCINGTWDSNPTTWINATLSGGLADNDAFSGYYEQGQGTNYIGLAYLVGSSSGYNIKFACLPRYLGDLGGGTPPQFFNYDGKVNGTDLALFVKCYKGEAPPEAMYLADLGSGLPPKFYQFDGKVDGMDLALFVKCYKAQVP